jgi:hypothetical protein
MDEPVAIVPDRSRPLDSAGVPIRDMTTWVARVVTQVVEGGGAGLGLNRGGARTTRSVRVDQERNTPMPDVERIQSAEVKIAGVQDALSKVQTGLQMAEEIAVATEQTKSRLKLILAVTLGLVGLSILLIAVSRCRQRTSHLEGDPDA